MDGRRPIKNTNRHGQEYSTESEEEREDERATTQEKKEM
jgi:hypothetical protein